MSVQGLILPNEASLKLQNLLQREYSTPEFAQLLLKLASHETISRATFNSGFPCVEFPRDFASQLLRVIHSAILERVFELTFHSNPFNFVLSATNYSILPGEKLSAALYEDLAMSVTDGSMVEWDEIEEYKDIFGSLIFEYLGQIYLKGRAEYSEVFWLLSNMMKTYIPTEGIFSLGLRVDPKTINPILMYVSAPECRLGHRATDETVMSTEQYTVSAMENFLDQLKRDTYSNPRTTQ